MVKNQIQKKRDIKKLGEYTITIFKMEIIKATH